MKPTLVVVTAILASAAASPTRADVLADFSSGATVTVGSATVDLGTGPRTSSGTSAVRKVPGSLDVTLSAADLGLALPITVHLRGALLRDGHIEYTIDDRYDPGVDLGAGERLQQLTGRLIMMATPVPGLATHTDGNAWLRLVGPGSLDATGTWGTLRVAVDRLELFGGVAQPPLAGFRDPSRTTICSGRERTTRILEVTLTDAARASGAAVELGSADHDAVHLPKHIIVRPGQRVARVTAHVGAGFVGTVAVTAAAGGIARPIELVVQPASACARR
jgi:hypothetical protein